MEPECCRELESGQDQDAPHQVPVFGQQFGLAFRDPAEALEVGQIFNFVLEAGPAGDRVVIREGDDVETLLGRAPEEVDGADAGVLIVDRTRCMNV